MAEMTVDMLQRAYRDGALRIVNHMDGRVTVALTDANTPGGVMELHSVQEPGSSTVLPMVLEKLRTRADSYLPFINLLEQYAAFPVPVDYSVDLRRKDIAHILRLGMESCKDWLFLDHTVCPNRQAAFCTVEEVLTYGGSLVFHSRGGETYTLTLWDFQAGFHQWLIDGGDWNRAVQDRQILLDRIDSQTAELILRLALHASFSREAECAAS